MSAYIKDQNEWEGGVALCALSELLVLPWVTMMMVQKQLHWLIRSNLEQILCSCGVGWVKIRKSCLACRSVVAHQATTAPVGAYKQAIIKTQQNDYHHVKSSLLRLMYEYMFLCLFVCLSVCCIRFFVEWHASISWVVFICSSCIDDVNMSWSDCFA